MDTARLFRYLSGLADNNDREWFEDNKAEYTALRTGFVAFVGDLIHAMAAMDARLAEIDPKSTVFRIHRDLRFTPDRAPYKTAFSAYIGVKGRKAAFPGYYIQLEPGGGTYMGGGLYNPPPPELARLREAIGADPAPLRAVLAGKGLKARFPGGLEGQRAVRAPRGFAASHPALDLILHKSYHVGLSLPDKTVLALKFDPVAETAACFEDMKPLVDCLEGYLAG